MSSSSCSHLPKGRRSWSPVGLSFQPFSFADTRTNLLPSNSLTRADGGMASVGSESVSTFDHQSLPYWSTRRREVRMSRHDTTISKLPMVVPREEKPRVSLQKGSGETNWQSKCFAIMFLLDDTVTTAIYSN